MNTELFRSLPVLGMLAALVTSPLAVPWCAAQDSSRLHDALVYGFEDHINPEAGTIELWLRPDTDVTQPVEQFYHFFIVRLAIGDKQWGNGGSLGLVWLADHGLRTLATVVQDGESRSIRPAPGDRDRRLQWEKGTWHHVALSWRGIRMRLYADGKLIEETIMSEPMPLKPPGFIVIGYSYSPIAVDELIVSSIERDAEQIRQRYASEPTEDEHTLLLDPMETLDPLHGRARALKETHVKLIPGKFGNAIQLYRDE